MLGGKLRMAPVCYHVLHLIPAMVAHEMNFFDDEGLHDDDGLPNYEVVFDSIVPMGLEKLGVSQAAKEKAVDIILDVQTPTFFFQRARNADLYLIAGWRNQHTHVWIGTPGIKSLQDLKHKKIGISDFGSNKQWGISIWLRRAGLNPDRDVEWVRGIYHPIHIKSLKSGKVDCIPVSVWEAEELKKEGFTALVTLKDQYPRGRPERTVGATGKILEERPDLVKSFLKGMIRAYWFMRDQPKNFEYVSNLERRLRRQSPDPEERKVRLSCDSPILLESMPFPIDGLPTGFEELLEEEKFCGNLDFEVPDIKEVCALDLVKEAYAELSQRESLKPEIERMKKVVQRWGY
jgi:ABC-type nitrate/sulfonate/bicarbonate transport system substrate-binding protein